MSDSCVASSIDWRQQFDTAWHIDFEYRQDANHLPVPVSLYGYEEFSGTEFFLPRDQLLSLRRAPFEIGPRNLVICFAANAEISCFLALGWPLPRSILDLYVEAIAAFNGRTDLWVNKGRPGLLAVLELLGLPAISDTEKQEMRDLILNYETYTPEQWCEIKAYNRSDVIATRALLEVMTPAIDWPRALHRGRFMAAIACEERIGLPVDRDYLDQLLTHWERLQLHYIARDDEFGLYDGTSFREHRMLSLIDARRWDWPQTATGKPELKLRTLGRQAKRYPELKRLVRLRDTIADLRISKLANTVGADGFSRISMLPFWTRTGRCQPSSRHKVFLPSLPGWLHGLLKPPPGYALVALDWDAQEIGIMAALSGDAAMIADYAAGDPHWAFGVRAGLVAAGVNKDDHEELRQKRFKPVTLGSNYGMTPYGIAAQTDRSLLWARDIHARHRLTYPTFHRWLGDVVAQAKFDGRIESPFGWPLHVIADTKDRTIMNFLAQAGGSDAMRIATIAATEAGIAVCASVHDAFWILAPLDRLEGTVEDMRDIMVRAGAAVTGGLPITASIKARVLWPLSYGDSRKPTAKGAAMWAEVRGLLGGELSQQVGG
jgi:DNA polymerase family A